VPPRGPGLAAVALTGLLAFGAAAADTAAPALALQERQCLRDGWQREVLGVAGLSRVLLWKAPPGPWRRGAIVIMHGGGGRHTNWCVANVPIVAAQVDFVARALTAGFAVILPDSTDAVTDDEGRLCGKAWDDELRARPNLDLPFLEAIADDLLPRLRPPGSAAALFLTGLSSGGYMTVRAATHLGARVTAFAPVSSGDPFGWRRECIAGLTPRLAVHGVGLDKVTGMRISTPGACAGDPARSAHERWPLPAAAPRPAFRVFYHLDDGVHDASCAAQLDRRLRGNGFPGEPAFVVPGDGRRSFADHLWLNVYTEPVLRFFASRLTP